MFINQVGLNYTKTVFLIDGSVPVFWCLFLSFSPSRMQLCFQCCSTVHLCAVITDHYCRTALQIVSLSLLIAASSFTSFALNLYSDWVAASCLFLFLRVDNLLCGSTAVRETFAGFNLLLLRLIMAVVQHFTTPRASSFTVRRIYTNFISLVHCKNYFVDNKRMFIYQKVLLLLLVFCSDSFFCV